MRPYGQSGFMCADTGNLQASDPNEKGKGKAAQYSAPISRILMRQDHDDEEDCMSIAYSISAQLLSSSLTSPPANDSDISNSPYKPTAHICGICFDPFTLVHSPNNAMDYRPSAASNTLPFGLALPCPGSHTYCHSCIGGHIHSKLDPDGDGTGNPNAVVFPIRCPECPESVWDEGISEDVAKRVLAEKGMLLWVRYHLSLISLNDGIED